MLEFLNNSKQTSLMMISLKTLRVGYFTVCEETMNSLQL